MTTPTPARTYPALLLRGLLAGLVAGLLAGAFAYTTGEPHVDAAIAIEETAATESAAATAEPAGGHHGDDAAVSRDGQKAGLFLATALYGIVMGGLLATAYTLLRRRLRTRDDGRAAIGLAAAALLGIVLVPFVKYPPNPPAVGDPGTINQRTIGYLALLVIGLAAVCAAVIAARAPGDGAPDWLRAATGTATFLVVVGIAYWMLPGFSEVPETFPATLLYDFRLAALGTQLTLWTALGLTYAALLTPARRRTPVTV